MKGYSIILIIAVLSLTVCNNKHSTMYEVIKSYIDSIHKIPVFTKEASEERTKLFGNKIDPNVEAFRFDGVSSEDFKQFVDYLCAFFDISSNSTTQFKEAVNMIQFASTKEVTSISMLISTNKGEKKDYINILAEKKSDGNYTFLLGSIKNKISNVSLIIIGKRVRDGAALISERSIITTYKPKNITTTHANQIFLYIDEIIFKEYRKLISFNH